MRKPVKWVLSTLASVLAVAGLAATYIAATFNPNDYKADIVKAIKEKTGRTLQIKGDIALALFPTLGMKLGEVSLSEPRSDRPFASLTEAVVAVKLMPLLSREVIVDAIELKGLRTTIARDASGRLNVDDLTGAGKDPKKPDEKTATPVKVDIDHIRISDGDVTFVDPAAGRYRLSQLHLKTGRVANGVAVPVEFSASIASDKHQAQLDTRLKGKLTFDLERQLYKLDGMDWSAKGKYANWSAMNAAAKGNVEARLATGEYLADALTVEIKAREAGADLSVKLDAPKLMLTKDQVQGGKVAIEVSKTDGKDKLAAKVTLAGVQGAFSSMKAGPLNADIETSSKARSVKAQLSGTLTGNLEARRFELPGFTLNARVTDPRHPKGAFEAAINGSARADLVKDTGSFDFAGKLDESTVKGKAGITKLSPLALTFDLEADQLDVDRLLGKAPPGKTADAKPASGGDKGGKGGKDDAIDLSGLKGLNAAGSIRIGKLTVLNLKSSQFRADLKVVDSRLNVAPISAQLYQGTLNGSLSAQAANKAVFAIKQTLSGVAVGPLLRDAADIDTLEGKGTVSVDLTTQGASVDALKKALNGTAAVSLADGSIKGIDIAGTIRGARDKLRELRGQQVQPSDKTRKTDFSELKATFDVKNGVAHNNDLSMKSPLLRVAGAGDIDIGNDRLNYVLKATLVATSSGQGGKELADLKGITVPVKLTGALDQPQYTIDFAGMVTDVAKQRIQDELLKRLPGQAPAKSAPADGSGAAGSGNVKDVIKDRLKGILGR